MKKDTKELLIKIRKRFTLMRDSDETNRRAALADMQFIHVPDGLDSSTKGGQWDENMKTERGKRPCFTYNKLRINMKRIINDIRAQTPSAQVRGVEDGDVKTAEVLEGLIRNILNRSNFDTIIDGASQYMVSAGMGAWRINSDYSTNTAFEQDITLEEIMNPFCLYADPSAKDALKIKARDWILTEKISKDEYKERYPKAEVVDFDDTSFDDDDDWQGEEVRIAEYWYKVPVVKEIYQLHDGRVVDADDEVLTESPELIKTSRTVKTHEIWMCVASGNAIVEEPTRWPGTMFPFVMCFGEHFVCDGSVVWYGAGRWAKDAQQSYNVSRTAITETIAQAPQAKWWTTTKQAEGHEEKWAEAHKKNFPFLVYNADPQASGAPQRMGGADIPMALIQESQLASSEIEMTTGRYANDVGAPNQANSGKQELIRNNQGDLATYNYPDNMGKAIQHTWSLLIDLIPKVYDTERKIRVLGKDGAEDYVTINSKEIGRGGEEVPLNDLSMGVYDVTVTIGANFSTKRQEFVEMMNGMVGNNPELMSIYGDLFFKAMDMPFSDEMAERAKILLPPEIQNMLNQDKEIPPEIQQMMQKAEQAMQMVEMQAQEVQQQAQGLQQEVAQNAAAKSAVEKLISDLEVKQARFEGKVAKDLANVMRQETEFNAKEVVQGIAKECDDTMRDESQKAMEMFNSQLIEDVSLILQSINTVAGQLQGQGAEINEIRKTPKPRVKEVVAVRENGKLKAVPVYEE